MWRFLLSGLILSPALFAQTPPRTSLPIPLDEAAYKKALAITDPSAQLAGILQFLADYPDSRSVPQIINRGFLSAQKAGPWNHARAVEFSTDIARRLAKASPMARSQAARTIALNLSAKNIALPEAESYARQATRDLNPDDHLSREHRWYQQKIDLDPKHKPIPFYPEEAREKYRALEAAAWSTLGRIYIKQGRDADARHALQKSLAAARTAEAAGAFAELAAKEGDTHTVLDALGTAILTGKADPALVEKFQAAYRDAGMRPNPEAWLDRRYRLESRNPLEPPAYHGPTAEPHRTVLLEILTGAACEPCLSVDLAADALLHRYSRQDLVLLAHHTHAPSNDPLVSAAAGQRAKYYSAGKAPAVFLDGDLMEPGEGTAAVARPVFDALDSAIQRTLAVPAQGRIQLKSSWSGAMLKVEAAVEDIEPNPALRLQLFLAETEVSYSGENGIRLHPMVTRSASQEFPLDAAPLHVEWTFALDRIPRNLAIIAILQSAKTKRVQQSAYLKVDPSQP